MVNQKSVDDVVTNIKGLFGKKKIAVYAICMETKKNAEHAIKKKQGTKQLAGHYWTNQLSNAIQGLEGYAFIDKDVVGWGLMHTAEHGKWLELAMNRKHAVLLPTVRKMAPKYFKQVREIIG